MDAASAEPGAYTTVLVEVVAIERGEAEASATPAVAAARMPAMRQVCSCFITYVIPFRAERVAGAKHFVLHQQRHSMS
jgi:hypothetical protein